MNQNLGNIKYLLLCPNKRIYIVIGTKSSTPVNNPGQYFLKAIVANKCGKKTLISIPKLNAK